MAGTEPTLQGNPAYKPAYLGGTRIDNLYLGNTSIPKAYLGDDIVYEKEEPINFFKITNTSNNYGTITLTKGANAPSYTLKTYRSDTKVWDTQTYTATTTLNLPEGTYILFDGRESAPWGTRQNTDNVWSITCNVVHDVSGDIMTLCSGDTLENVAQFFELFLNDTQLVNASGLTLSSTACTVGCYQKMFNGCTNLVSAPVLPATTLANYCYTNMFSGCTSLTTAPELPATTLAPNCYYNMFYGCTSLTTAPALPATALAYSCYLNMFYGCTSLTTAPALPADTIASDAYDNMFRKCSSLSAITCLATSGIITGNTGYWVSGVSATGVFTCAEGMENTWTIGNSGIPTGWTIKTPVVPVDYFRIVNNTSSAGTIRFVKTVSLGTSGFTFKYSTDGLNWTTIPLFTDTITIALPANGYVLLDGSENTHFVSQTDVWKFNVNVSYSVSGDIMTLVSGGTSLGDYAFAGIFMDETNLTDVSGLIMPTTLSSHCCQGMFLGCTSITASPVLSAGTLADSCYFQMFSGCTSLNEITCLATDISASNCTYGWVTNAAASGTFYCDSTMTGTWTTGVDGVPTGWTIQTA